MCYAMAQWECAGGLKGKFEVRTDFGSAWVSVRESALGWSPMISMSEVVSVPLDLPLVRIPVCLKTFWRWLQWDFPQGAVPLFPRSLLFEVYLLSYWSSFLVVIRREMPRMWGFLEVRDEARLLVVGAVAMRVVGVH